MARCATDVRAVRLLLALMAAAWTAGAVAAGPAAGEVAKLVGRAATATLEGEIRNLAEGDPVHSGDTVVTSPHSFVRLKLSDGAFVLLRPNTRFQIEEYRLGAEPASDRSVFNLLKGGFRAVTGLIGTRSRDSVRYRTAVATIGIRGTDFEVIDCTDGCPDLGLDVPPGLYFKVHQGAIGVDDTPFEQGLAGFAGVRGDPPVPLDFDDPGHPLNQDPTPAADPDDCP